MELRQLKYFLAVVDCGSLSRAASQVFVAQSALSRQIADLENELGAQLLYRGRTGVTPTESGKTFYAYAQAIFKQLGDARTAVLSSPRSIVGSVVMALPQSVTAALALPLIRAARETLPGVSLHLNEELTGNMLEQVRQGRVDLTVFTRPAGDLVFHPLVEEEFCLMSSADDASLPSGPELSLDRVARIPLVMPAAQHSHCTRAVVAEALERLDLPFKIAAEVNSVHILKSLVEAGMAPTVLPYALAAHEIETGRLTARRIRPEVVSRTLGVCHAADIPLSHAKQAVAALVQDVARDLCERGQWQGATYIGEPPCPPCDAAAARQ